MPVIVLENWIPAQPEQCFDTSLSVDAHLASMRDSGETVLGDVTAGILRLGDAVTWRAKHFGVPFTMTSRISAHVAPSLFVDEQVSGPFRVWRHEHRFEAVDGGTRMTDHIRFESPGGPLGRLVNRVVLTKYMTRLMQKRNRWLVDSLAASGS